MTIKDGDLMSEKTYKINIISGIECKNGKHYADLSCTDKDGKSVKILVETTNQCEHLIAGKADICENCDKKCSCEICEPEQIVIGGSIVIVDTSIPSIGDKDRAVFHN